VVFSLDGADKQFVSGRVWKSGRVVEGTGLENQRRGNPSVGSNPTSSAIFRMAHARVSKKSSDSPTQHLG
jgi:hypothetical protein